MFFTHDTEAALGFVAALGDTTPEASDSGDDELTTPAQLVAMATVGALTGMGLWLIGVPQALALGIVAGLLDFIPNVGPILASVPGILAAASAGTTQALYALALYIAIQTAENNLITPIVQRRAVDLPPALTMVALLVMGLLGGVLGLLLAVPLAAVLTVAVRMAYVEDVLGDREP